MNEENRPIPVPRPRQRNKVADVVDNAPKISYENVEILNNKEEIRPVPAPRKPKLNIEVSEDTKYVNVTKPEGTGAIKKVPNIPGKLNNDLKLNIEKDVKEKEEDNLSLRSGDSGGSRYKTSSPGDIIKSIGSTSKLLTESITERVSAKGSKARHKVDKKIDAVTTWGFETGQKAFKNVRKSLTLMTPENIHMSLTRKSKKKRSKGDLDDEFFDKRQSDPAENREIFNKIQFNSPMNNKVQNIEDLSNIPESSYEVPKSNKRTNFEILPTYDEACKSGSSLSLEAAAFQRNTPHSQSMYSSVVPKTERSNLNKSDSNLNKNVSSSDESIPMPSFPPPVLMVEQKDGVYGKLNIVPELSTTASSSSSEEDNTAPCSVQIREKKLVSAPESTRATFDSVDADDLRIFARRISELNITDTNFKSESWSYYDTSINNDTDSSSPEPFYINSENATVYGQICEMEEKLLKPNSSISRKTTHDYDEVSISEIIDEFDPFAKTHAINLIAKKDGKSNQLLLLEDMLGAEDYGTVVEDIPAPPIRFDSLTVDEPPPKLPERKPKRTPSVIVHQNLRLPSDSIENLADEAIIDSYCAKVEEDPVNLDNADLSYPSSSSKNKSNWFVAENLAAEPGKFIKNNLSNPVNDRVENKEKINKKLIMEEEEELPTYREAISDTNPVNTELPATPNNMRTSVKTNISNFFGIKRKSSLKENKSEVKTLLEMIPKPLLTEKIVYHKGHLLKFPSGMIGDILNELSPRAVVLQERKMITFLDPKQTQTKETIPLNFLVSIQCVLNHKFNNEGGIDIHCFEIVLSLPKAISGYHNQQLMSTNPNMMITSTNSGNIKVNRQSYIFGIHKKAERNAWMMKLLQSVTDVFPEELAGEFNRAGWCYMKKSTTSNWSGAWLLLCKRRFYFYNFTDKKLETIDLRKARCIGPNDSDESIKNLHIESGPTFFIDCPPHTTLYFIMNSPRETQIWRKIITDVAHNNGTSLRHQQLTKNDIPVLVDKCINFIYAHGSMSEGIYRKSGSCKQINTLLGLFRQDAFAVQITRVEYSEHDVSSTLKKFMRDLPEALLGKCSASLISVSYLTTEVERIECYKELLHRLPKVEYQTLKKLLGHLNFIHSLKKYNKMGVGNLAMIWGYTLLHNPDSGDDTTYNSDEANVITDLITFYKNLFEVTRDEIQKEQLMLTVLQKYHAAAENLSSNKNSGDLKIWITVEENGGEEQKEEKQQFNVTINPTMTAFDVCKELAPKTKFEAHKTTLYEVILDGALFRPIHFSEKVLDIVLRWSYWDEPDRKDNYLALRPTKIFNDALRTIQKSAMLTPTTELKYADKKTKNLKPFRLQFFDDKITIMKKIESKKDKDMAVRFKEEIVVKKVIAYLGLEKKRDDSIRWAITLVDDNFTKRSKEAPYIGSVLGGIDFTDQTLWYSSILYSLYKDNILPNAEIIIP